MPAPLRAWYSLRDIESLALRHAVLSGDIELGELTRLSDLLHDNGGRVGVNLRFESRGETWQALQLEFRATLRLICQRCLEPLEVRLDERVAMGVVETAAMEQYLPEGYEPVVLKGERLSPIALVEDELIVSLPLVPRHAGEKRCDQHVRAFAQALETRDGETRDGETRDGETRDGPEPSPDAVSRKKKH